MLTFSSIIYCVTFMKEETNASLVHSLSNVFLHDLGCYGLNTCALLKQVEYLACRLSVYKIEEHGINTQKQLECNPRNTTLQPIVSTTAIFQNIPSSDADYLFPYQSAHPFHEQARGLPTDSDTYQDDY